jgi:phage gp45-like
MSDKIVITSEERMIRANSLKPGDVFRLNENGVWRKVYKIENGRIFFSSKNFNGTYEFWNKVFGGSFGSNSSQLVYKR